ncbi:MAG TPA: TylF/MycF/NovP-related O-methyltransferase [Edaphocola sp.]|nr:TylF/MycF/NovP-related O-methyltransferase [Edaphocola sp.]
MTLWIHRNKKTIKFNDFYTPKRDYDRRYKLYNYVANEYALETIPISYFEFGVASGFSFKWWLSKNNNPDSSFYGFDTFEGLPEEWGTFDKGAMAFSVPEIEDNRGSFFPGLFQDSLPSFILNHLELLKSTHKKVIHLDADLYSATIFSLSQLYPYLNNGDIIFFDEFNVAMHEFKAFDEFISNFYIDLVPIGAVNNFYQIAFVVNK